MSLSGIEYAELHANESEYLRILQEPGPTEIAISEQVILPLPESVLKPTLDQLCSKLKRALFKYGKYVIWSEQGEIRTMCGTDILEIRRLGTGKPGRFDAKTCSVLFQRYEKAQKLEEKASSHDIYKRTQRRVVSDSSTEIATPELAEASADSILIQVMNADPASTIRPTIYRKIKDPASPSILIQVIYPGRETGKIDKKETKEKESKQKEKLGEELVEEELEAGLEGEELETEGLEGEEIEGELLEGEGLEGEGLEEEGLEGEELEGKELEGEELEGEEIEEELEDEELEEEDTLREEAIEEEIKDESSVKSLTSLEEVSETVVDETEKEEVKETEEKPAKKEPSTTSIIVQVIRPKVPEIREEEKSQILKALAEALAVSDLSLYPSYTNFKIPYYIRCRERYARSVAAQREQQMREFEKMENRKSIALEGVNFRRQFGDVGKQGPPLIPLLLPYDKFRLKRLKDYVDKMMPTYIEHNVPEVSILLNAANKQVDGEKKQIRDWMETFKS